MLAVRALALAFTLVTCGAALAAATHCHKSSDVVVVGAGLAGLSAADAVKAAGRSVVVLEARNRIGGRLESIKATGWKTPKGNDIVVDMGASWIEGLQGNPMTQLAKQAGLRLFYTPVEGKTQYIYGQDREPTRKEEADIESGYDTLMAAVEAVAEEAEGGKQIKADQTLQQVGDAAEYEVAHDGNRADREQQLGVKMGVAFVENEAGSDEWRISTGTYPYLNRSLPGLNSFAFDENWAILPEGIANAAEPLAEGLDIRLGDAVKRIKYSRSGVRVKTASGKTYCGKRTVVAVPIGVLKRASIKFKPALPRSQRRAISKVPQGYFHKLFMLFRKPFWDAKAVWVIRVPTKVPGQGDWKHVGYRNWIQFANLVGAYEGAAVLLAINNGKYAAELDSMSQAEVLAEATAALRYMYGEDTPEPEAYIMSNWTYEPHTWGAYPYWEAGVPIEIDDSRHVAERIFWAGDWVDGPTDLGYTHGAVLKGREAAKLLLDTF